MAFLQRIPGFCNKESAEAHIGSLGEERFPRVIKAGGLCAGKGVIVAADRNRRTALEEIFGDRIFGSAADEVVARSSCAARRRVCSPSATGAVTSFFFPPGPQADRGGYRQEYRGNERLCPAACDFEVMRKVEERIMRPAMGMAEDIPIRVSLRGSHDRRRRTFGGRVQRPPRRP